MTTETGSLPDQTGPGQKEDPAILKMARFDLGVVAAKREPVEPGPWAQQALPKTVERYHRVVAAFQGYTQDSETVGPILDAIWDFARQSINSVHLVIDREEYGIVRTLLSLILWERAQRPRFVKRASFQRPLLERESVVSAEAFVVARALRESLHPSNKREELTLHSTAIIGSFLDGTLDLPPL